MIGRFTVATTAATLALLATQPWADRHVIADPSDVTPRVVNVRYAPDEPDYRLAALTTSAGDYACLVQAVFFDAGIDPDVGQEAVAHVVLNRVRDGRWPRTPCAVVWQPRQFTWTRDGKSDLVPVTAPNARRAMAAVDRVLAGSVDHTRGATCYARTDSTAAWTRAADYVVTLGSHSFYRC
jgi:spore germination cell wall hydrolase CwlJ-like protein